MSSAYITQELEGNISGKSFIYMYIRYKIRPRNVPCGTLMLTRDGARNQHITLSILFFNFLQLNRN